VRPAPEFVRGHLSGSLFIAFDRRSFVPLVRLLAPAEAPIVLVASDAATAQAAGALLGAEGYRVKDTVVAERADVLAGGAQCLEPLPTVSIAELAERLAGPARDFRLIDVRQSFEWKLGAIDGSVLVPLKRLPAEAETWTSGEEILLLCEEGVRSATAASYLRRRGFTRASSVEGGVGEWARSGRPLVEE
jgi:rhodanese-related sulfurtransferase